MDQFRFNIISPMNTKVKHKIAFTLAIQEAKNNRGALVNNPTAHINGSACSYFTLSRCEIHMPNGTPIIPEHNVNMPKT